jgi:hypothetical protein
MTATATTAAVAAAVSRTTEAVGLVASAAIEPPLSRILPTGFIIGKSLLIIWMFSSEKLTAAFFFCNDGLFECWNRHIQPHKFSYEFYPISFAMYHFLYKKNYSKNLCGPPFRPIN